jgi:hypothetical protein
MKNCASSWVFTGIIPGCTVNKTKQKQKQISMFAVFRTDPETATGRQG